MMLLGLHLRLIGRPGRNWPLEKFFRHAAARGEIAAHFACVAPA